MAPDDKLRTYRAKRDFAATSEPEGGKRPGAPGEKASSAHGEERPGSPGADARFVVQEHHATRLHWDLRLEHDGALASWAVPNGIPFDPAENRLAVRTEDHPLEYLHFEGQIPEGSYGAGAMMIWDRGTFQIHKWEPRKVEVSFEGERLRGRYGLFPIGKAGACEDDWMIHRMDPPSDPSREPMLERVLPMLASAGTLPGGARAPRTPRPPGADREPSPGREPGAGRDQCAEPDWSFEVKWDGVRAIAYAQPGRLRIESRNLKDITGAYPELRGILGELGTHEAVLDGEIVAFDESGKPSFERLQRRMHVSSPAAIRRLSASAPVVYAIFDLLYLDGRSLMALPYVQRRSRLQSLELAGPAWRVPAAHSGDGAALLEATRTQGLEGVVAKRVGSRYEPGRRTGSWVKVKHTLRQELVVGGWIPGEGRRAERIGALLMGYFQAPEAPRRKDSEAPRGKGSAAGRRNDSAAARSKGSEAPPALIYAGRVGTGFSEATLEQLSARLATLRRRSSPFGAGLKLPRAAVFVEPCLVAEIEFAHWTAEHVMRAPSFKGLRKDKEARQIVLERGAPVPAAPGPGPPLGGAAGVVKAPAASPEALFDDVQRLPGGSLAVLAGGRRLRLSNWEKVLFPKAAFTKGDLIAYYARIGSSVLPHLRDRPLTLKRYPNGVEGQFFYEKQSPSHRPHWVPSTEIGSVRYTLAQERATLIWLANLADIELHTSLALAQAPGRPTMLVFDLDPGAPAGVLQCAEVALVLRGLFEQLGLQSVVKTSGSKGLQVYVPLNSPVEYERSKAFARDVAELLEQRMPELVISRMSKRLRPGKVLVDWSQNDAHKTTVTVYSVRARERPTVSTPVGWDEVAHCREVGDPDLLAFDTDQVLSRVEEQGDLFAPLLSVKQELPA